MKTIKENNKTLCKKYPFLIPRNVFSGKRITEGKGFWPGSPEAEPEYDWEFTELDNMPKGWRIAFGEQLCDELKTELDKAGLTDKYHIIQIKEKYGSLRWYDAGNTAKGHEIIRKYETLSETICIRCGKPATRITTGWISPYCDDCLPEYNGKKVYSIPIKESE